LKKPALKKPGTAGTCPGLVLMQYDTGTPVFYPGGLTLADQLTLGKALVVQGRPAIIQAQQALFPRVYVVTRRMVRSILLLWQVHRVILRPRDNTSGKCEADHEEYEPGKG
jgi:hypothetical protein